MSLLRYTGHPFVDVGVAVITAFYSKKQPEEVESVDEVVAYMLDKYINPAMSNYLGAAVFANVGYANPALNDNRKFDADRRSKLAALLNMYKLDSKLSPELIKMEIVSRANDDDVCIFSREQAIARVSRTIIPMTMREDAIAFLPEGQPLLPIAGWCVLALLAMPLGALNSGGRMLLVHTHNRDMLLQFAKEHLNENQRNLQMSGLEKWPNYRFAKTQFVSRLVKVRSAATRESGFTVYHFSSASKDAKMDIYHLPSNLVNFLLLAQRWFPEAWGEVVSRANARYKPNEQVKVENVQGKKQITHHHLNYLYEDLFDLPQRAAYFLRRYMLRMPIQGKPKGDQKRDPRYDYSWVNERTAISWELTQLFLERIMNMEKSRIETIRKVGDTFTQHIRATDRRLLKQLLFARKPDQIMGAVVRAVHSTQELLIGLDEAVSVFFSDEGDTLRPDWYLARDLLLIRIVEQLHTTDPKWLETNNEFVNELKTGIEEEGQEKT